ncbi:hypothetical protein C8R45DRAFT_923415 [Mycena sanguinolenta]|nr:hypothetical protein C8R45DRAFT_923415 [Mycena sanguinolenta]
MTRFEPEPPYEWRKQGIATPAEFGVWGMEQSSGDLESLPAGLNSLTSVLACLWWWYRAAGSAEGSPLWRKVLDDVTWVLSEKCRGLANKRRAPDTTEAPPCKRVRSE